MSSEKIVKFPSDVGYVKSGGNADEWQVQLRHGNDNLAIVTDGVKRSDDGATAGLSGSVARIWREPGVTRRLQGSVGLEAFTQRQSPTVRRPDLRTDELRAQIGYDESRDLGDGVTATYGGWVGISRAGDGGAEKIQNWAHTNGPFPRARPLQGKYTGPGELSVIAGADASVAKRFGLVEVGVGAGVEVPVGPGSGIGRAVVASQVRVGQEFGPYGAVRVTAGQQWRQGDAYRFDGAPVDGFVASPSVAVGYNAQRWNAELGVTGNDQGTQVGLGDRQRSDSAYVKMGIKF